MAKPKNDLKSACDALAELGMVRYEDRKPGEFTLAELEEETGWSRSHIRDKIRAAIREGKWGERKATINGRTLNVFWPKDQD